MALHSSGREGTRAMLYGAGLAGAAIAFVVLAVLATTAAYFPFDLTITRALQAFHPVWFNAMMVALTWMGFSPQAYVIAALVFLLLVVCRQRWEALVGVISVIGCTYVGMGIKELVARPRPSPELVNVVYPLSDFSFPSGHVLFFTVFYGFLIVVLLSRFKSVWWRTVLLVVMSLLVGLIGVSRVYLGQHWASDAVGGYILGGIWLALTIVVYRRGRARLMPGPR